MQGAGRKPPLSSPDPLGQGQTRQLADVKALQIVSEEPGNQACSGWNHADRVRRAINIEMETSQLLVIGPRKFDKFGETISSLPSPGPLSRQVPCIPSEIIDLLPLRKSTHSLGVGSRRIFFRTALCKPAKATSDVI
ncbi:hypothetical protein NPIL_202471 [Nephila pilipes]|uniref:Uncharacterized protein n=1 Tax=Nephila pilipes TaxID=299642 RepID=A0A8X6KP21_NEPPI|nr:hypothetical protein NPIL_202471 [Nephila pilipes]